MTDMTLAEMRAQHGWFERIIEMTPEAIFIIEDGYHVFANPAGLALYGASDLSEIADRPAIDFLDQEFRSPGAERALQARDGGSGEFKQERILRLDGTIRHTEGATAPITFEGRPATLALARDITDRIEADERERQAEERFVLALAGAPNAIAVLSADLTVLVANAALATLFGNSDPIGSNLSELIHPDDMVIIREAVQAKPGTERQTGAENDVRLLGMDSGRRFAVSIGSLSLDSETNYVLQLGDVTGQRLHEANLAKLARTDDLTGLPNRSGFDAAVTDALDNADRSVAVVFCDLDNFKTVNDSLGHSFGDRLLVGVSERLLSVVRSCDVIARFGGDEFTLLIPDVEDAPSARAVADRLRLVLAAPFEFDGHILHVSISLGIALGTRGDDADALLADADAAMYAAKAKGPGRCEVASAGQRGIAQGQLRLVQDLRLALEGCEIQPHYQPIVELFTGRIVGVEALARWHRQGVMVPPSNFIPVAEANGLIGELDRCILRQATGQLRTWMDAGLVDDRFRMAVNISAPEITDERLFDTLIELLEETGMDPGQLLLEVTERTTMGNLPNIEHGVAQLGHLGIGFALDDFGVGESSLSRLRDLPFAVLKLDRSFVEDSVANQRGKDLLAGLSLLGRALGLTVVAEGVETAEQLAVLIDNGVDLAQGFLLARPATAADTAVTLASGPLQLGLTKLANLNLVPGFGS